MLNRVGMEFVFFPAYTCCSLVLLFFLVDPLAGGRARYGDGSQYAAAMGARWLSLYPLGTARVECQLSGRTGRNDLKNCTLKLEWKKQFTKSLANAPGVAATFQKNLRGLLVFVSR